jgi:hypothetical protein
MAKTNIELDEALKAPVGDEAARMIAEVVPAAKDVATKTDLESGFNRQLRWMIGMFVPLWLGVYASLATLIVIALKG